MHDVGFIDVDKKLKGMANYEDQDDSNKNCCNCQISIKIKYWFSHIFAVIIFCKKSSLLLLKQNKTVCSQIIFSYLHSFMQMKEKYLFISHSSIIF